MTRLAHVRLRACAPQRIEMIWRRGRGERGVALGQSRAFSGHVCVCVCVEATHHNLDVWIIIELADHVRLALALEFAPKVEKADVLLLQHAADQHGEFHPLDKDCP